MKTGRGSGKGSGFEREVCKRLGLWITGGEKLDVFWRSASSGGRATTLKARGISVARHAGDIVATAPEGHALTDSVFLECKSYANLHLPAFVLGQRRGNLNTFWEKAKQEAGEHDKLPLLIAKQNRQETLVITDRPASHVLPLPKHASKQKKPYFWPKPLAVLHPWKSGGIAYLYRFDDLFPSTPKGNKR